MFASKKKSTNPEGAGGEVAEPKGMSGGEAPTSLLCLPWYLMQCDEETRSTLANGHIEAGKVADHYLAVGAKAGLSPHPLLKGGAPIELEEGISRHAADLFDPEDYLERYGDVTAAGIDPLLHFFGWGVREGRSPHALFDTDFYLRQLGEAERPEDPFAHYLTDGSRRGLSPHPDIDATRLLAEFPEWANSGMSLLEHVAERGGLAFLASITREGIAIGADSKHRALMNYFDVDYYHAQLGLPDTKGPRPASRAAGYLEHYLSEGHAAGLKPFPLFVPSYYLSTYKDVANAGVEPFTHWVLSGRAEGRSPHPLIKEADIRGRPEILLDPENPDRRLVHPLFDETHYVAQSGVDSAQVNPLVHYITVGQKKGISPNPFFDPDHYAAQLAETGEPVAGLEHYLAFGAATGLSPNVWFDPLFYARQNGGIGHMPPERALSDFLFGGKRKRACPHPLFDPAYYQRKAKLPPNLGDADVLAHFLEKGAELGIAFHPLFDIDHYATQRPPESWAGRGAFLDYVTVGWRTGASPHPLFDPAHYVNTVGLSDDREPFAHYLSSRNRAGGEPNYLLRELDGTHPKPIIQRWLERELPPRASGHAMFDREFYEEQLARRDVQLRPDEDPLVHYLTKGHRLGLTPSRFFVADFYRRQSGIGEDVDPFRHYLVEKGYRKYSPHPAIDLDYYETRAADFDRSREPVLDHFLRLPAAHRPDTHPFFDREFYLETNQDLKQSGVCPMTHFIEFGMHEERVPNAIFSQQYVIERPDHGKPVLKNPFFRQFEKMAEKPVRLLFVSHDASRTGAPAIILRLLEDFSRFTNVECIAVLTRGGDRTPEFKLAAHTFVINKGSWEAGPYGEHARADVEGMLELLADNPPVAAFVNSAESRYIGHILKDAGIPVISLVHELADFYPASEFEWIYRFSDKVVYPSEFVHERAKAVLGDISEKTVVRGQGLLRDGFGKRDRAQMRKQVLKEFGLRPDTMIVLGCGTIDQRKGIDYFTNIAKRTLSQVGNQGTPVVFLWIGEGRSDPTSPRYMADMEIRAAGLERSIRFIGGREDVEPYFVAADLFMMSSRGDPYPCVIHEAMACGLPTIAFEGGGGAPELIGDSGVIVPLGDVEAASNAILDLRNDGERRRALADRAMQIIDEKGSSYDYFQFFVEEVTKLTGISADEFGQWRGYKPGSKPPIFFLQMDWSLSGVNAFTATLVRHLRAAGYPVELLFTNSMDYLATYPNAGLPEDLPVRFLKPHDYSMHALWDRLEQFLLNVGECVIVPNFDYRGSAVTSNLSERVGVIGIAHSDHIEHYEHVYRLGRYWNRIVGVSSRIAEGIVEVNPTFADRLSVIPYGVEWAKDDWPRLLAAKGGQDEVIRLVYAGRFVVEQKNIYEYILLADELHGRGVPFEMHLCGDGAEFWSFRQKAASHIAAGRIVTPGRLNAREMAAAFDAAHVLCLLSDYEGLPVAMLESMAHGCIPVCYEIDSGIDEVIKTGDNGFVVGRRDVKAAADAIEALWRDQGRREKIAKRAYETIARLGLRNEDMGEKYRKLVDEVYAEIEALSFRRPRSLTAESPLRGITPSPLFPTA